LKRAVILHGTDGAPDHNWFPWLKKELESRGYEVWIPELPNNHFPNRHVYNDFLFNSGWDFSDNLVIGHSSGAVSTLNLIQDERCPKIDVGVLVGIWASMDGTELDKLQFKDLFGPDGFDFNKLKAKSNHLLFIHGDDDPHCPLEQAKWLAGQTSSPIVILPGGGHLGSNHKELTELITELQNRGWLHESHLD